MRLDHSTIGINVFLKMIDSRRKPDWLKIKLPKGKLSVDVLNTVRDNSLHTICTSGKCPNQGECWGCGTATIMIGGGICTRNCRFCNVTSGKPDALDKDEPMRVANSIKKLGLKHVVLTSVDRDDLPDLGASHWVEVIRAIRSTTPHVTMEVLIPDFQAREELIQMIIDERPDVISHNLETVRRLTPSVRSVATYDNSIKVIEQIAKSGLVSKSGIMLGLGELDNEVVDVMNDLLNIGCEVMTIGQYLQPSQKNIEVESYITPEQFNQYKEIGLEKGFRYVESGPLVRSSYHAERHVRKN